MIFALIPSRQEVDRYLRRRKMSVGYSVLGKPGDLLSLVHAEIAAKDLGVALDPQSERGSGDRRLRDRRRCLEGSPRNTKVPPTVAPTTTIDAARAAMRRRLARFRRTPRLPSKAARAAPTSSPQVEQLLRSAPSRELSRRHRRRRRETRACNRKPRRRLVQVRIHNRELALALDGRSPARHPKRTQASA